MEKLKIGLIIGTILSIVVIMCIACRSLHTTDDTDFYNIIYTQNGKTIEYYDVTNLSKWEGKITFTTCDGATVILDDGCIEIIPIDVD